VRRVVFYTVLNLLLFLLWTLQNADPRNKRFLGCRVRRGHYDGYFNKYKTQFDSALRNCMRTCSSCKVILTGHSQGGGISLVAAIANRYRYNPEVVTFGGSQAVFPGCKWIVSERHYRFINVNTEKAGNFYDVVPMMTGLGARHYGRAILLNGGATPGYLGLDDDKTRHVGTFTNHFISIYAKNMKKVRDEMEGSSMVVQGWENGRRCLYNDECASGRCEGFTPPKHCEKKLKLLSACNENSDCDSGRCELRSYKMICTLPNGKVPNHGPCLRDSHCESGRCEFDSKKLSKCEAKRGRGKYCNENSDCLSNRCSWLRCK